MKTKLSLITLFACAAAGTPLFADRENYDGQDLSGKSFSNRSMRYSSWIGSTLTGANLSYAKLTGADFTDAVIHGNEEIEGASFASSGLTLSQLESTASFKQKNLTRVDLTGLNLRGWNFSGVFLAGANFAEASLTGANFTDAVIHGNEKIEGANFYSSGLTLSQLRSTASFKQKNLTRVKLSGYDFREGNFSGFILSGAYLASATLTNANLSGADLSGTDLSSATLTNANFTGADIAGASFTRAVIHGNEETAGANFALSGLSLSQLESTASYKQKNLKRVGLNGLDLRGWNFSNFILSGADFTDAVIHGNAEIEGASFSYSNSSYRLTLSQLESTASFKQKNLTRVNLTGLDLHGGNFSGFMLSGASLSTLTDANLSGADLSGADLSSATLTNADFTDAVIHGNEEIAGASFYYSGLTLSQLESTASFKQKNLTRVDLRGYYLRGRNFSDFALSGARLSSATLTDANLSGADLSGADFWDATLTNANFTGADIAGASFTGAVIHGNEETAGANFALSGLSLSQLESTKSFRQKNLTRVGLSGLDLRGWNFSDFILSGADFTDAVIHGNAEIAGADFKSSGLTLSQLESTASFKQKNLTRVNLLGYNLRGGNFSDFALSGANLSYATLTDADFTDAVIHGNEEIKGARFYSSGLTLSQLESTASFKQKNLTRVNLHELDLSGGNFSSFILSGADLSSATLTNANLSGADLSGADLSYTKLTNANLSGADLSDANLSYTKLTGADFTGVDLSSVTLTGANFTGTNLTNVNLTGANLSSFALTNVNLSGANLSGADLSSATLTGANFTDAVIHGNEETAGANFDSSKLSLSQLESTASFKQKNLTRVGLRYLDLSGGNFSGFILSDANLSYATLTDADFSGANLTGAYFTGATLKDANFTDAVIHGNEETSGADFASSGLTLSQLESTESFKQKNLTRVDLRGCDLSGGNFSGFILSRANLSSATLTDADFTGVNLTGVDLSSSTLTNANLLGADLSGADFKGAVIHGNEETAGANFASSGLSLSQLESTASFKQKNLKRVGLSGCDLRGGNFSGFMLSGADLSSATLTGAHFSSATLTDADFTDAVIHGNAEIEGASFASSGLTLSQLESTASFKQKNLTRVDLRGCDLSGRNFSGFILSRANLSYATLTDADFTGVDLSSVTLKGANFTKTNLTDVNLTGVDLSSSTLTNANLTGADIAGANLRYATLTNANFTNADLSGSDFKGAVIHGKEETAGANFASSGLSLSQLESTASFEQKNLKRVGLSGCDLRGGNFSNFILSGADFTDAVIHGNAEIEGASFASYPYSNSSYRLTLSQLESTASYKQKNLKRVGLNGLDLRGWNFSGFMLSGASLSSARLANADFTDAVIHGNAEISGSYFDSSNLTLSQLESTASFKQKNLTRVSLRYCDLSEIDFTDFELDGTDFGEATLTGADFRGANGFEIGWDVFEEQFIYEGVPIPYGSNVILADGVIGNFDVISANDPLHVRRHAISAKLVDQRTVSGVIVLERGATLDICPDAALTLDGGEIRFEADENESGLVSVKQGGGIEFSDAARLVVDFTGSVSDDSEISILTWEAGSTPSGLDFLVKGQTVFLTVNGEAYDEALWDFSTDGDALVVTFSSGYEILIEAIDQIVNLPGAEYVGTFDSNLREFQGSISGSGEVHSGYDLTFAGDASAHTGTTHIDGGKFTIVDAARLGTGAFEVADAGTLRIEGTRDFANTLSGGGTLESAGTITLSGDASGFSGVTKVESGTLKIADTATLGTGSFEVAGTLNLQGDRTFSATLTGSGAVVTAGAVTLSSDVSAFTGSIVAESGTLTVAEGKALTISGTLEAEGGATLKIGEGASVSIAASGGVTLSPTAQLLIEYSGAFSEATSFDVLTWEDGANVSSLSSLTKGGNLSLLVNGSVYDTALWNFSTTGNALTIFGVPAAPEPPQNQTIENGDASVNVGSGMSATFDPTLGEFTGTLSGSGEVHSSGDLVFGGDAGSLTGTTYIDGGTFTVSAGATLGTGAFEVAGTLSLNGDRTFGNATSGDGVLEIASGATTFTQNVGTKTLSVKTGAEATLGAGVSLTHTDATADVSGTLNLQGDRTFTATLTGAGTLTTNGVVSFESDASGFSGVTKVESGTLTIADTARLGTGAFDVAGTLVLNGTRTFANATRGNGAIELSSGSDVTFSKSVGVKTLNVNAVATLNGGVSLTHGADAVLNLAGTLALDADAGEKVSLGGGKVVLASSANLDLSGNGGAPATRTFAATNASLLESGARVTIFENGSVAGDVENFLRSDAELSSLASNYVVIYDATNGLTVQTLTNPSALADAVNTSDLSASFVAWALGGLTDELAALPAGFTNAADLSALGGGNDPLLNALLSGDAGTARAILDRLSPKSFAAMIAMPVETFHDDARNVSARLAQRRFDRFSEKAPWEFFAQSQTISVDNDTSTDAPTFDFDRYGVFAGADYRFDETTTFGVAVGAGTGEAKIHAGGGKIESDDYRLTVFGGKTLGGTGYVNAGAQLGFASYDVKRTTDYGSANASADGWNAGVFAEAGTLLTISDANKLYAMPYVGLAYTHASTDSFTESGNERAAFAADSLSGDSLRARVGCAFSWGFDVAGARWRVGLDAAYSRELLDEEIDVDVTAKDDGSRISEKAKALPQDVFSVGPTVNVDVSPSASVYAGYSFSAGTDSSTTHSANVGFRMRF